MAALLIESGASLIPIFTSSLPEVLSAWGNDIVAMAEIYLTVGMKNLGVQAADIFDSSAPPTIYCPVLHPGQWTSLQAMEDIGFDLASQRLGDGSLLNYLLYLQTNQSFFLNSEHYLKKLDPFPWHWINRWDFRHAPFLLRSFRHFRLRLSDAVFKTWLNLEPERGWSPLCRAASQGLVAVMENCLSLGAKIDFEGCPLGSALMIASACGSLDAVKLLVRRGAAICYVGRKGPRSALSIARSSTIRSWLLVRQFSERLLIEAASKENQPDLVQGQCGVWSGIVQARIRLVGWLSRQPHESALDQIQKLACRSRQWRGEAAPMIDGYIYPQHRENKT